MAFIIPKVIREANSIVDSIIGLSDSTSNHQSSLYHYHLFNNFAVFHISDFKAPILENGDIINIFHSSDYVHFKPK